MILGHGIDIISFDRINKTYNKFNEKFVDKIMTYNEKILFQQLQNPNKDIIRFLAKSWTIKEATSKAIGSGLLNGSPLHFKDIDICNDKFGKPEILLSKNLIQIICNIFEKKISSIKEANKIFKFHISTTNDIGIEMASVILEML